MSSVGPKTVKKDNKAKRRRRQLKEHNADGLQAEPTTVKRTRINWSTDDRMANAVEEWDNDRPYLNNKPISMKKMPPQSEYHMLHSTPMHALIKRIEI